MKKKGRKNKKKVSVENNNNLQCLQFSASHLEYYDLSQPRKHQIVLGLLYPLLRYDQPLTLKAFVHRLYQLLSPKR